MEKITVKKWEIVVTGASEEDFVSLTDLARIKNSEYPADVIKNWLRLRSTIEYLGVWEQLNNPHFKLVEFDQFKSESGKNFFVMTPTIGHSQQSWIFELNANCPAYVLDPKVIDA